MPAVVRIYAGWVGGWVLGWVGGGHPQSKKAQIRTYFTYTHMSTHDFEWMCGCICVYIHIHIHPLYVLIFLLSMFMSL